MLLYRLARYVIRAMLRVFFRQLETVGQEQVPGEGQAPLIMAGNHPNSLIDPALMIAFSGRIVFFAAQDGLFRNRLSRLLMGSLGAVPIKRRSDHGDEIDNTAAFEALFGALEQGRAIGIFPEGLSHGQASLARFKTGAARIALGFAARHPGRGLRVQPCGLTYVRRRRFRSRVLVQYGAPIPISPELRQRYAQAPRETVQAFTAQIEAALRDLTVNAPDWATLRVLDGVRRLYQPPRIDLAQRVELARRFSQRYQQLRDHPEVKALYQRVDEYLARLEAWGISDRDLAQPPTQGAVARRLASNLALIFLWLPLAGPGLLLHAPLGLLVAWAGARFTPRADALATSKLVLGLLVLVPVYVAGLLAAACWAGWAWALLAAQLQPQSGHATIRVLERGRSLGRILRRGWRWMLLRQELLALRAERKQLEAQVVQAVERFLPADMEPLFPERLGGEEE